MSDKKTAWEAVREAPIAPLTALFTAEPDRLSRLSVEESGM